MRSRSTHQLSQVTSIQQHAMKKELRPDLWDDRYTDAEREKLMVVAQQYGLDPMTKEVMIIRGNIYVTASGLQKLALLDPEYDGCEIELVEIDWANNFFVVKARVWKKNCSHPFEDYGDADPTTSSLRGHALFRHAITRARARAMRSAFAIPFCSLEELDDDARGRGNNTRRPKSWKGREETPQASNNAVTEQQLAMLARYRKELKLDDDAFLALLGELFQIDSEKKMTRSQCSQLLDELSQRKTRSAKEAEVMAEKQAEAAIDDAVSEVEEPAEPVEAPEAKPKKAPKAKKAAPKKAAPKKTAAPKEDAGAQSETEALSEDAKEEPVVSEPVRPVVRPKAAPMRTGTLPRWTVEEQKRIADDLVQRMQEAKTMKELRREWELFQGVRHQLSEEWFAQICETKEQRKAALAA